MNEKKFEIRTTEKKKFEIRPERNIKITDQWFRQENENDCGPCLILNSLHRISGAQHIPESIHEVREDVNRLRQERGLVPLDSAGWFTSEDVQMYLQRIAGLRVDEFPFFPDDVGETQRNVRQNIEKEPFVMVYSTAGRHFRAVVQAGGEQQLLDSFNMGPEIAAHDSVESMINQSARTSTTERPERIGIVRSNTETSER